MEIITPDYRIIVESRKPLTYKIRQDIINIDESVDRLNKLSQDELLATLVETLVDTLTGPLYP